MNKWMLIVGWLDGGLAGWLVGWMVDSLTAFYAFRYRYLHMPLMSSVI